MFRTILISGLLLLSSFSLTKAQTYLDLSSSALKGIVVEDAYVLETTPAQINAPVFMNIINHTQKTDFFTSASSPVTDRILLNVSEKDYKEEEPMSTAREDNYYTYEDKREKKMIEVYKFKPFALSAKRQTRLSPTTYFMLLVDLKAPLRAGQSFPVTMRFENHEERTIMVEVRER